MLVDERNFVLCTLATRDQIVKETEGMDTPMAQTLPEIPDTGPIGDKQTSFSDLTKITLLEKFLPPHTTESTGSALVQHIKSILPRYGGVFLELDFIIKHRRSAWKGWNMPSLFL